MAEPQGHYENNANTDEIEIDLQALIAAFLSKWYLILLVAVLFGGAAFGFFNYLVEPTYESKTQIYVVSETNSGTLTYSDLQLGTQLGKDYVVLAKSRSVVERVIDEMNLDISYDSFLDRLSVSTTSDTRIMSITYTDTNPYMAKDVADKVRDVIVERIKEVMQVPNVQVVDMANLSTVPVGPKTIRNTAVAGILGAVLAMGIITVCFLMNDRIKTPDDIERYLHLSVLGTIPVNADAEKDKRRKSGKKSKKSKR